MIFFFNLQTLEDGTLCDSNYLVSALEKFYKGVRYPKNAFEKYKPLKNMAAGTSYLLNPAALFKDKSADIIYKAQYIRLSGRRDYTMYKTYGIKSLDLTLYPDLDYNNIKSNPLLTIANNKITFKYEEI